MPNPEFCNAVNDIARRVLPDGWDVSPDAPNNFLDLALHVATTGRMCVSDSVTEDCQFDPDTYHAFRAWHDWCHLNGGHPFTLRGECAAVRMQLTHLALLYGRVNHDEWKPILIRQIIHDNFGDKVFCPGLLEE
jgi:hypothetical protein